MYTVDIFEEYDEYYTIQFLYAVYLLTFLFQAKCKVFPSDNVKENFSWYVEVLFSLYEFLLDQSGKKYLPEDVKTIKAKLLQNHIDIVFMLFYFYTYASKSLDMPGIQPSQFYGWLLYDELK
ncbi:hypothetical protein KA478_04705 [Patescibacteria group bacterium]|nr:hypothetical protein [Patescibacteria group bacterium]